MSRKPAKEGRRHVLMSRSFAEITLGNYLMGNLISKGAGDIAHSTEYGHI